MSICMKTYPTRRTVLCRLENCAFPSVSRPLIEVVGGVVLYDPDGINIFLSFKLEFLYFRNKAEYEALITGLTSALQMVIRKLWVQRDSKLIAQ